MPHFDANGEDTYLCQVCGQVKPASQPSVWRPDLTGHKSAGNVCPTCFAECVRQGASATRRVQLSLVGLDGNAFSLMGAFQNQARKEGWTKSEIKVVLDKCMSGDYDNLLRVLSEHCEG